MGAEVATCVLCEAADAGNELCGEHTPPVIELARALSRLVWEDDSDDSRACEYVEDATQVVALIGPADSWQVEFASEVAGCHSVIVNGTRFVMDSYDKGGPCVLLYDPTFRLADEALRGEGT